MQLGEAGATVYITGRTLKSKDGSLGSLEETANEVNILNIFFFIDQFRNFLRFRSEIVEANASLAKSIMKMMHKLQGYFNKLIMSKADD